MRILIVSERFHPEEFRVNDLARDWVARGHQVRVLTQVPSYPQGRVYPGWNNEAKRDETWQGVRIQRVRTVTGYRESLLKKLLNYVNFAWRGSRATPAEPELPDLIFCYNTGPLTSALPAVVVGRLRKIPVVIWTQDLWPESVWAYGFKRTRLREALLNSFVRFVYQRVDKVLVSCEGFSIALTRFLPPGQTPEFVPNWADELDPDAMPVALAAGEKLHFTFAGNLGKLQNLDRVLSAFAGLPPELLERMQLNLIGDGSHAAALKQRVQREGIPAVRFWGRVPSHEMAGYYRASHVLLVTLEDRPLFKLTVPSKFQTCLAAGRPILAAVGGEVNRLVTEAGIGLTAEPGSEVQIRQAMQQFISMSGTERSAMATRCGQLLEQRYSRARILDRLDGILAETVRDYRA